MAAEVLLGTQGWHYPDWVGPFYPPGTRPRRMLSIYSRAFPTVEIDSTFYDVPAEHVVDAWRQEAVGGFVFSLKVPQQITHERRLVDAASVLERLLDRVRPLGPRLGALLLQLPPDFRATSANRRALAAFCETLPTDLRWAVEFRDRSWLDEATLQTLRRRNVALVLADGRWIGQQRLFDLAREPTADFGYVRWMGPDRTVREYSRVQTKRGGDLVLWSQALHALAERVDTIFGYANNHFEGHSPHTVRALQQLLGQEPVAPEALRQQAEFF